MVTGSIRSRSVRADSLRRLPRRNGTPWRKDDRQTWAHVSLGRSSRCIRWLRRRSPPLLVIALGDAVGVLPAFALHRRLAPGPASLGPYGITAYFPWVLPSIRSASLTANRCASWSAWWPSDPLFYTRAGFRSDWCDNIPSPWAITSTSTSSCCLRCTNPFHAWITPSCAAAGGWCTCCR